ncbi:PTS sugar transporter subunit IIB, partial [Klebsiella pneumoniae]
IGPDPRNFNQRVSLGRNDLLIRTFPKEGSKNISKAINLLPTEIEQLQQLVGKGVEVEIRQVPNDRKQLFAECV